MTEKELKKHQEEERIRKLPQKERDKYWKNKQIKSLKDQLRKLEK